VAGHFDIENIVTMLQFGQNFDMMSTIISSPTLPTPFPNRTLRRKECTPLYLLLKGPGNPYQWITCRAFHQPSAEMILFLWWLIIFLKWRLWPIARRESQQRPLPRSSLNECGYILGYHKPSSHIGKFGSLTHSGRASSHCCTPISPNPFPSIPRWMAKLRSSTR
jgi:hypothetical protein